MSTDCFKDVSSRQSNQNLVVSCPLYIDKARESRLATITGQNGVTFDNAVYCHTTVTLAAGFDIQSQLALYDSIRESSGIAFNSGVVAQNGGSIAEKSYDEILSEVSDSAKQAFAQELAAYLPTQPIQPNAQRLTLQGNSLAISGGNTIWLPVGQSAQQIQPAYASSLQDGIISAQDWNQFASKQNTLRFDGALLKSNGNTVGLMTRATGEILKSSASGWICASDLVGSGSGAAYMAGSGIVIDSSNIISSILGTAIDGVEIADGTITAADVATIAGLTPGTYNNFTVNAQGQVTAGTNVSYLTAEQDGVVGNEVSGVVANRHVWCRHGRKSIQTRSRHELC